MNLFRVADFVFALPLATAWLVMPLASAAGRTMDGPFVNFGLAATVAVAVITANFNVESGEIWTFSGVAFLVSAVVHVLGGTGANTGDASATVIVAVWVVSVVVAGAVAFRDRLPGSDSRN